MCGLIANFGPWEMVFILIVLLIIVGPGKLPKVGESLGAAMKNFRKAREDVEGNMVDAREEK